MANKPAPPKAPKAPTPAPAVEAATVAPESVPTPAPAVEAATVEPTPEEAVATFDLVHVTRKGSKQVMQVTREHYERYASKLELVDA